MKISLVMRLLKVLDTFVGSLATADLWALFLGLPFMFLAAPVCHELGHIGCGWLCGVPASSLRIGMGPSIVFRQASQCPIEIGLVPVSGHVNFPYLPRSRHQRMAMYASGPLATAVVGVLLWVPDAGPFWLLRWFATVCFAVSTLENMFSAHEGADGTAIRGLWRLGPTVIGPL